MTSPTEHPARHGWRRRGLLVIPHAELADRLGLPDDVTPLAVVDDPIRGRVLVVAESDRFPETGPGTEPPAIPLAEVAERHEDTADVEVALGLPEWDDAPHAFVAILGLRSCERCGRHRDELDGYRHRDDPPAP